MKLYRQKYRLIETYGVFLMDVLAIAVAYFVAHKLRILLPFGKTITEETAWFPIYVLCIFGCLFYNLMMNRYEGFFQRGYFVEFEEILKYNVVQFVFLSTCVYLFRLELDFSRLMLVYFVICDSVIGYAFRAAFKTFIRRNYKKGSGSEKVLIVTDSVSLQRVEEQIQKDKGWNYEVVGVALTEAKEAETAEEEQNGLVGQTPQAEHGAEGDGENENAKQRNVKREEGEKWSIVAHEKDLLDVARQMPIDLVLFYLPSDQTNVKAEEWIQAFLLMGIPCYYSIRNLSFQIPNSGVGTFAEIPVLCYHNTLERDWRMSVIKRIADLIGGFVGMLITAIFFPFIAIAIKLEDSKGPIFFSQTRIGKNGRRFRMYKFRSMYADAEARKKELLEQNEVQGPMFKIADDPRITKVGKFLRRTSLDELPQFWNILRGDMSMVGTRPPTVEEFEQYNDYYRRRMSITPGLTGLWQVSGRSDIKDFNEVVKLDLQYIDHWSVWQDLKILILTVGVVLKGNGSK